MEAKDHLYRRQWPMIGSKKPRLRGFLMRVGEAV